jgi:hypothetical protein
MTQGSFTVVPVSKILKIIKRGGIINSKFGNIELLTTLLL